MLHPSVACLIRKAVKAGQKRAGKTMPAMQAAVRWAAAQLPSQDQEVVWEGEMTLVLAFPMAGLDCPHRQANRPTRSISMFALWPFKRIPLCLRIVLRLPSL